MLPWSRVGEVECHLPHPCHVGYELRLPVTGVSYTGDPILHISYFIRNARRKVKSKNKICRKSTHVKLRSKDKKLIGCYKRSKTSQKAKSEHDNATQKAPHPVRPAASCTARSPAAIIAIVITKSEPGMNSAASVRAHQKAGRA